jgi:succinoglycan biosynthesis transport protein ExoP
MYPAQQPVLSPREVARILLIHRKRWLVPALAVGLLAAVYAAVRLPTWEASQALIVRNEAAGSREGLGKFSRTDEMKTVQETILELAKSRGVLTAALKDVGPPANYKRDRAAWPTARDVAHLRKNIDLAPPKGAEFGKTEVFYLKVRSQDRVRAVALATAIVGELKQRFQKLLDDRAASIIHELDKAVALAETDLKDATGRLAEMEKSVGSDLAELRSLYESLSGPSDLRQEVVQVENELRAAQTDRRAKAELLSLLKAALSDPSRVEALPSRLLESHATLRRLSEGLSAARLNTSTLLGRMSRAHPLVQVAETAQSEVLRDLNDELQNAVQIADVELRLADARVESLQAQLADARARFDRLAGLRTRYATLVAETRNRTELLETARRTLADARASQASARTASLIAQIDLPDTGARPVGPSRSMIVLLGLAGGLLTGLGVLFLTLPSSSHDRAPANGRPAQTLGVPPAREHSFPVTPPIRTAATDGPALHATHPLSLKRALQKIVHGNGEG